MKTTLSFYVILTLFCYAPLHAQLVKQEISFESGNPFSLSDIILNLEAQEKQTVFGQLSIPSDSLNPKKISFNNRSSGKFGLEKAPPRVYGNVSTRWIRYL
jgi:hypothetical protein|tara:strand:+ start:194 stop:496 length:303 start_codon:yes stop_codon:yes gene_type:complete